ncbi:hypothetical protein GW950_02120 [Candidatus Wolfebacteria bacterium]|nr:hypothetical protein [Candidatus Wolfebacteria bacterium]
MGIVRIVQAHVDLAAEPEHERHVADATARTSAQREVLDIQMLRSLSIPKEKFGSIFFGFLIEFVVEKKMFF